MEKKSRIWLGNLRGEKTQIAIAIIFVFVLLSSVFAGSSGSISFGKFSDYVPEPRLTYPIYEEVNLAGDFLEFRWWNDIAGMRYFDFRLYKGYNMYEQDLIYKERLPQDVSSIKIKADLFEDNQVYTWSLLQISLSGQKSDKSFNSFRVFKK
ncbi:MAG: hypothetical protein Q8N14_01770 [Candidatus Omnitrophota bacterium]|nr:hypothetical protein [Candidatus Omnitrophota bacterium]